MAKSLGKVWLKLAKENTPQALWQSQTLGEVDYGKIGNCMKSWNITTNLAKITQCDVRVRTA